MGAYIICDFTTGNALNGVLINNPILDIRGGGDKTFSNEVLITNGPPPFADGWFQHWNWSAAQETEFRSVVVAPPVNGTIDDPTNNVCAIYDDTEFTAEEALADETRKKDAFFIPPSE